MSMKKEPLTKAQEEEMSSALIAKLLAEDAMGGGGSNDDYYAEYSNDAAGYESFHARNNHADDDNDGSYEEMSDDNYAPRRKQSRGKKTSTAGKRGKKRKTTESAQTTSNNEADGADAPAEAEDAANGKTKSKKQRKPLAEGLNSGVYSEEEEALFLEGLELFGREWTKVVAHVRTRDANSIRSHAQKHFIKLCRDQVPLPDKVRESGEGYTLSGKPLDPESAAARAYLGRGSSGKRPTQQPQPQPSTSEEQSADTQNQTESKSDSATTTTTTATDTTTTTTTTTTIDLKVGETEKKKSPTPPREKKKSPKKSSPEPRSESPSPYGQDGRTDYSKTKLRRVQERKHIDYSQLNGNDGPLTLVKCEPFTGKPASGVAGCQPFELHVHSNALLGMDFHAHLMDAEIIGFLAGEWDKEKGRVCVKQAFPCRSLNTGQNHVNVEMDPTSAIETRQRIVDRNMTVVGWYHSHPTFVPDPSIVDVDNQRGYQIHCREERDENGDRPLEPFVGAIVSPYDPRLPGSASVFNWFYVSRMNNERGTPKRLVYEFHEDESFCDDQTERLLKLVDEYKHSDEKVNFAEFWRPDIEETKLVKLIKSLGTRMPWIKKDNQSPPPAEQSVDPFLTKVQSRLQDW